MQMQHSWHRQLQSPATASSKIGRARRSQTNHFKAFIICTLLLLISGSLDISVRAQQIDQQKWNDQPKKWEARNLEDSKKDDSKKGKKVTEKKEKEKKAETKKAEEPVIPDQQPEEKTEDKKEQQSKSNKTDDQKKEETAGPPEPKEPPASEQYENIKLNQYYGSENRPNMSVIDAKYRDIYHWQQWDNYDMSSFWTYYSLDVASVLGNDFKITDKDHVLNQLDDDIKYLEVDQFKDLIIETLKIDEDGVFSDPDIYISLKDEVPTLKKHDVQCDFWGEDVCMVSGKDILERNVTKITIGIFCLEQCKFRLQAELDPELILNPGKMHKFYFKENQQRIFRFKIPESNETSQVEIKGINENKFAQWEMMVLQGNKVPNTGDALLLEPAWENGYIGHFVKHCYCFCTGCNYTVLVSAKSSGYISIGAKTSNNQVDLRTYPGGSTYDTVYDWGAQCYKYQVTRGDQDFRVRLEAYSGNPDAYVNPIVPITQFNYTRAKFNSKDQFWNEEMVLEPAARKQHDALTGMYYICVYGSTGSAYKISAKNEDHSIFLKAGLSESGYIEYDQIKHYYFTDNLLLDPKAKVKFSGHLMSGAVKLMTKICPKPKYDTNLESVCNLTKQEMLQHDKDEKLVTQQVGSAEEAPDHNICAGEQGLTSFDQLYSQTEAHCMYVVGIIGLANYTSHFSVMVELIDPVGKNHPILLSEGVPQLSTVDSKEAKFFMITVDDPNIKKLKIQLTTIHGNPDIYVSSATKEPNWANHEKMSRYNGFYPDNIQYEATPKFNLTKNFYVGIYSDMFSTFSLNYFTEDGEGKVGFQKLLVGKKLRGIIHVNWDKIKHPDKPILDQPSLIYHFQVSSQLFKDEKEVEVRLNSEHGNFLFIVQELLIPDGIESLNNRDDMKTAKFIGSESQHVVIKADQLMSLKQKKKSKQKGDQSSEEVLIDFYVRVFPYIVAQDLYDYRIVLTEPYTFTIAFYDEVKLQELDDGQPHRGVVLNQTFDYYMYEIHDTSKQYEISLQPISGGNPDLVYTLDPFNKFPTPKDKGVQKSDHLFSKDSLIVTQEMIKKEVGKLKKMAGDDHSKAKPVTVYIGVYTRSPMAIYSIVMTKMVEFNPVKLQVGQMQAGQVSANDTKFYSFKTSGQRTASVPMQIDVVPTTGDVLVEVTILDNYAISSNQMLLATRTPDLRKNVHGQQYNTIVMDPQTDDWFTTKCEKSCLVIIAVKKPADLDRSRTSFKLQVSQEFQELVEGMRVTGIIQSLTGKKYSETQIDRSRYKFFKFYKVCGQECDLTLDIYMQGLRDKVLSILVNFEDPRDEHGIATKLPVWENDPTWKVSIKYGSQIVIEGTEPYFSSHQYGGNRGRYRDPIIQQQTLPQSAGNYLIAIHSFEDCTFSIEANVVKRHGSSVTTQNPILDIQQIYQGRQDRPVYLMASQTKYFYYKNWRNDDLTFKIEFMSRNVKTHEDIRMRVGKLLPDLDRDEYVQGTQSVVPVQYKKDLNLRWKPTRHGTEVQFKLEDSDFCMLCTYVIEVKNEYTEKPSRSRPQQNKDRRRRGDVRFRMIVEQFEQQILKYDKNQSTYEDEVVFKGDLRLAEPRPIELDRDQTIFLVLKDDKPFDVVVELELLIGEVNVTLYRYTDNKVFFQHPCPMNADHHIKDNIVRFNLSHELPNPHKDDFEEIDEMFPYALKIQATTTVFEGIAYLRKKGSLDLISDGRSKRLSYVYSQANSYYPSENKKVDYFLLLPSSHNLELQLNTQLTKFASDLGTYSFGEDEEFSGNGFGSMWSGLDRQFFSFKVGLKKIELKNTLKGRDVSWKDEYINDQQFDYVMESSNNTDDDKLFRMVEFEVNPSDDIILVRTEGTFDPKYAHKTQNAEVEYSLKISSSEVNYLAPGESTRAIVSDNDERFKIFEFFINKRQFPKGSDEVDLFLEMTPCTGLLEIYVSDDYKYLFNKESELQSYSAGQTTRLNLNNQLSNSFVGTMEVEHKRSQVRRYRGGRNTSNIELDLYEDDFGVQGKRIKNIQLLNHRKLYIAIKTLNEEEMDAILFKREQKEIEMMIEERQAKSRRERRKRQFMPLRGKFSHSHDAISTFEIEASYIEHNKPDILDMYRIQDHWFGIKFEVSGHRKNRQESFTWSPIEKLDAEAYEKNPSIKSYSQLKYGVLYRLYLGYEDETIDMFSSLCQMEAQKDAVPLDPTGIRRLLQGDQDDVPFLKKERNGTHERFGNYQVLTVQNKNQVILKGKDYTKDLRNAVVMAYVYDNKEEGFKGKPKILAYAPVSFEKSFQEDPVVGRFGILKLVLLFAICSVSCILIWLCIKLAIRRRSKKESQAANVDPGLQMRNMPYDNVPDPKFNTSTQSSMEAESNRPRWGPEGLSERTSNTLDHSSAGGSQRDSQIQKTQQVESSDEEEKDDN